jgi:hypothetical protein
MYSTIWRRPFDLGGAQLHRVGGVDRLTSVVGQLGHVGAPLARVALRPQDGAAAREAVAVGGPFHQRVDGLELADGGRARSASTLPMRNMVLGNKALPAPSPSS